MPKLTKQLIDATPAPATGDTWIWDTELQGFGVRIQPSGRRTYTLRYRARDAGRTQRKMVVCRCSDATPARARDLAREFVMKVAAGQDPAAERRPSREAGTTIEAMFKARIVAMAAAGRTNADEVARVLLLAKNNAADAFGRTRRPADVTPADVIKFVSTFYQAGHRGAADKARGYVAAAFAWAIKSANDYTVTARADWGVTANPAAAIAKDRGATNVRDRNLAADELKALWDALGAGAFDADVEMCLRTMIACGQRVQETLRMDGSEIDTEKAVWTIPAEKTKGRRRQHVVPLPAIIVPHLAALKARRGDGPLFTIEAVDVSRAVRRYVVRSEVDAFQPRDLRRTWKSRTHDAGVDRFTRDLIQQHAKNDTGSKNYDRSDYSPQMRAAMDKWNAWLTAAVGDPPRVLALAA